MNNYWNPVINYLSRLGVLVLLYTITRIIFFWCNKSLIGSLDLLNLIGGLRFDIAAICIINLPFSLLVLFPARIKFIQARWFDILFIGVNFIGIAANLCDCAYYSFTLKRTTSDLFSTKGIGVDILQLLPSFIADFWYLFLLAFLLVLFLIRVFRKWPFITVVKNNLKVVSIKTAILLVALALSVIGYRGGLQLRPINIVTAGVYGNNRQLALVLNTPFTIIRTATQQKDHEVAFLSDSEAEKLLPMSRQFNGSGVLKKNVVIIVLESFGEEYIGALGGKKGFTPFLDSLIPFCIRPEFGYANGRKSIEAMPAITASIPTLSNLAFVSSAYASNQLNALPAILGQHGYSSSFYHGGHNGTMGFDNYAKLAGYDSYFGLNEYPKPEDYDGKWGIPDEPFLQWFAQQLNCHKQPFMSTVFTLSSHHPFKVPDKYSTSLPKGDLPILQSVAYADLSLAKFFENVKHESWFSNTVFVITGDHTSLSNSEFYSSPAGVYRIPILFYEAGQSGQLIKGSAQQLDITPSILELIGYKGSLRFFGKSVLDTVNTNWNLNYLEGNYQLIQDRYLLRFNGETATALFDLSADPLQKNDLLNTEKEKATTLSNKTKAIIQQYTNRQLRNSLTRP